MLLQGSNISNFLSLQYEKEIKGKKREENIRQYYEFNKERTFNNINRVRIIKRRRFVIFNPLFCFMILGIALV